MDEGLIYRVLGATPRDHCPDPGGLALLSYQWANNLIYTLTGNEPPPPAPALGAAAPREGQRRPRAAKTGRALDALWARAERQVQDWVAINARLPQRPDGPVTFFIQEPVGWHRLPRSQLVLDAVTADVVKWEPFAGQNMGRRLRAWVRPLHTGEAGGLTGQTIAFLASAGGTVLVWTGVSLAWRRLRGWRRRTGSAEAIPAPETRQEVSAD
jgi:uncharacterized iron-regulated membrane protein